MPQHKGDLVVKYEVRCRLCGPCRNARRSYWALAAQEQTRLASAAGHRTWFGTLTLSAEWQDLFLQRAMDRWLSTGITGSQPNWENVDCEERFAAVRRELHRECRKYFRRLRHAGHRFKYMLVFERHKSGLPHMHLLLHEEDGPILKRELQSEWIYGFSGVSIVGGRSKRAAAPAKAAWYVAKYLSKSNQSRQMASPGYRPMGRNIQLS